MMDEIHARGPGRWLMIAALLVLVITAAVNSALLLHLVTDRDDMRARNAPKATLPCAALPVRLVHEDPQCADKLLQTMNVTNVHILAANTTGHVWSR